MQQTRIEKHRERKGWTRALLGVKSALSERTITNLERSLVGKTRRKTQDHTQRSIAEALGVASETLFDKHGLARLSR